MVVLDVSFGELCCHRQVIPCRVPNNWEKFIAAWMTANWTFSVLLGLNIFAQLNILGLKFFGNCSNIPSCS
jgi:hypothetical protein